MAEINKLDVGKVLDKLRSNDAKKTTRTRQLDDKIKAIDDEVARMRAQTRRLKPGAGTTKR
jgi:hypothetical protein